MHMNLPSRLLIQWFIASYLRRLYCCSIHDQVSSTALCATSPLPARNHMGVSMRKKAIPCSSVNNSVLPWLPLWVNSLLHDCNLTLIWISWSALGKSWIKLFRVCVLNFNGSDWSKHIRVTKKQVLQPCKRSWLVNS